MADVALLWFRCKNPDCGMIGEKDKQNYKKGKVRELSKIKKYQRRFLRYVEGFRIYRQDETFFACKYGEIVIFSNYQEPNSYVYPIIDKELCGVCIRKIDNEKRLLQENDS